MLDPSFPSVDIRAGKGPDWPNIPGAKDWRLPGTTDWFPASHWSSSESNSSSTCRQTSCMTPVMQEEEGSSGSLTCEPPENTKDPPLAQPRRGGRVNKGGSSRSSPGNGSMPKCPVAEQTAAPESPPKKTPEGTLVSTRNSSVSGQISKGLPQAAAGASAATHEEVRKPGKPSAVRACKRAANDTVGSPKRPPEVTEEQPCRVGAKVSLVCGPLAVQKTLTERQLFIERRMVELRQQNRRRLQRRQQEAKEQQLQRLREQHAAILARRQRIKLASLWKERGMAAAARPPLLLRGEATLARPPTERFQHMDGDIRTAEKLLAALVVSESISLQEKQEPQGNRLNPGGLGQASTTVATPSHLDAGVAASTTVAAHPATQPHESCPSFEAGRHRAQLTALPRRATDSSAALQCMDSLSTEHARCAEGGATAAPAAPQSSARLAVPHDLRPPSKWNHSTALRHRVHEGVGSERNNTCILPPSSGQQQTNAATSGGLSRTLNMPLNHPSYPLRALSSGPPTWFKGATAQRLHLWSLQPSLLPVASDLLGCSPGSRDSILLESKAQGADIYAKHRPRHSTPQGFQASSSLHEKQKDAPCRNRAQAAQPVVVVADPHLKKQLDLKLQEQMRNALARQRQTDVNLPSPLLPSPVMQASVHDRVSRSLSAATERELNASSKPAKTDMLQGAGRSSPENPSLNDSPPSAAGNPQQSFLLDQELSVDRKGSSINDSSGVEDMAGSTPSARVLGATGVSGHERVRAKTDDDNLQMSSPKEAPSVDVEGLQLVRVSRRVVRTDTKDTGTNNSQHVGLLNIQRQLPSYVKPSAYYQRQSARQVAKSQLQINDKDTCGSPKAQVACDGPQRISARPEAIRAASEENKPIQGTYAEQAIHKVPTVSAVWALEEAEEREEERLLLLEVSRHIIEKQAESRRKEQQFRCMQVNQQLHAHHGGVPEAREVCYEQRKTQQCSPPRSPVVEHETTVSVNSAAASMATKPGAILASRRQRGSPTGVCYNPGENQLQKRGFQRQTTVDSKSSHEVSSVTSLCNSPGATMQDFRSDSTRSSAFGAAVSSRAPESKLPAVCRHAGGTLRLAGEPHDQREKKQHLQENLLVQQESLLRQLLQHCLLSSQVNVSQWRPNDARPPLSRSQDSEDASLLVRSMQRSAILQTLRQLLLLSKATVKDMSLKKNRIIKSNCSLSYKHDQPIQHQRPGKVQRTPRAQPRLPASHASAHNGSSRVREMKAPFDRSYSCCTRTTRGQPRRSKSGSVYTAGWRRVPRDTDAQGVSSILSAEQVSNAEGGKGSPGLQLKTLDDQHQKVFSGANLGPLLGGMMLCQQPASSHQ